MVHKLYILDMGLFIHPLLFIKLLLHNRKYGQQQGDNI